jgi:mRNA interferase RelE/StbE
MLKLDPAHDVEKFLRTLPPKQFRQVMLAVLRLLSDPSPHDARPIKGLPGYLRIDVGEYRAVYRVDGRLMRKS